MGIHTPAVESSKFKDYFTLCRDLINHLLLSSVVWDCGLSDVISNTRCLMPSLDSGCQGKEFGGGSLS